jgi:hypothetical protein
VEAGAPLCCQWLGLDAWSVCVFGTCLLVQAIRAFTASFAAAAPIRCLATTTGTVKWFNVTKVRNHGRFLWRGALGGSGCGAGDGG